MTYLAAFLPPFSLTTTLFLAAALALPPVPPAMRVGRSGGDGPKAPRDGPRGAAPPVSTHRAAADITLFAACCEAGLPLATAAAAVADTYEEADGESGSAWHTVAALTALGVHPERAWSELHPLPGGAELAGLVALSNASGSAIVAGCSRIVERLQAEAADEAKARAERAGVLIALPLTACFLPAFFVLGLAPAVISLGSAMLH